jgi:hypothetical protein
MKEKARRLTDRGGGTMIVYSTLAADDKISSEMEARTEAEIEAAKKLPIMLAAGCPEFPGEQLKYFIRLNKMEHTAYHEFQKGKWDGETFWKSDSLLLSDEIYRELHLLNLFRIIPGYDPYEITEINRAQWNMIKENAATLGTEVQDLVKEADFWVKENFETSDVFTIIGL